MTDLQWKTDQAPCMGGTWMVRHSDTATPPFLWTTLCIYIQQRPFGTRALLSPPSLTCCVSLLCVALFGAALPPEAQEYAQVARAKGCVLLPEEIKLPLEGGDAGVAAACGTAHSVVLTQKGKLYTFGDGEASQVSSPAS